MILYIFLSVLLKAHGRNMCPGITSAASQEWGYKTKTEGIFGEMVSLLMLASILHSGLYLYLPGFSSHESDC